MRLSVLAVALAMLPTFQLQAAENVAQGRVIAETWCRPCHTTSAAQTSDLAKPFGEIAASRTPQSITAFLVEPHGQMPNIQLARQQIADVVAYIETLKTK